MWNQVLAARLASALAASRSSEWGAQARGAEILGMVERYKARSRLCYVRGPEGIIVMLGERIG